MSCPGASIVLGCLDKREKYGWTSYEYELSWCQHCAWMPWQTRKNTDERVMSMSCPGAGIVLGCLDKREKIRMNELWVWVVLVPVLCSDALTNEKKYGWTSCEYELSWCQHCARMPWQTRKIRMNELWVWVVLVPALCSDALTNEKNTDERVMSMSYPGASIVFGCLDKREKYGWTSYEYELSWCQHCARMPWQTRKIRMNELLVWVVLVPALCSDALANEKKYGCTSYECELSWCQLCARMPVFLYIYIYMYQYSTEDCLKVGVG
jgi:hypothetical protein